MEGRGYSDLLRNSSEEMILKSLMENPIGSSAPNMETLGFRNSLQNFRVDSEELFSNWLMNGEIPGFSSGNGAHRTRQLSRKISTEVISFSNQQNGIVQKQNMEEQSSSVLNDQLQDVQFSIRNAAEKSMQASNLFLAKAWFHSSQPMTRSRSSELRRRYAAMQNSQMQAIAEAQNNTTVLGAGKVTPKLTNELCDFSMVETTSQPQKFISPSNSATSPFDTPQMGMVDTISSVVSMLKGSLEKKRLDRQVDTENLKGTSNGYSNHQPEGNPICNQDIMNQVCWPTGTFQLVSTIPEQQISRASIVERTLDLPNMETFVAPANQFRTGTISQERSQSGSSTAVPTLSTGFEVGDDISNSAQTISVCEGSKKHTGNGILSRKPGENRENGLQNKFNNGKKASGVSDNKKGNLIRVGSVSSALSVDKGDPTKKRRVERSRKMAEAKERILAPALPTDVQAVLKRCETLEKEVRSLKLNLSFMNRKDSEQTKQIEELQQQNDELKDEKRRLVEEIERIYPETGNC